MLETTWLLDSAPLMEEVLQLDEATLLLTVFTNESSEQSELSKSNDISCQLDFQELFNFKDWQVSIGYLF